MTIVDDIIALATAEIGSPYVYGDEGPDTFDCSGLVQYVYGLKGYKLPRTAAQQQKYVKPVTNPLPGDLVYWGDPAYHTAIYIGGGKIISAPKPGAKVHMTDLYGSPTFGRVPGLGTAIAGPIGYVQTGLTDVGEWLGGARELALEGIAVILGVGLIGFGIYRAVTSGKTS